MDNSKIKKIHDLKAVGFNSLQISNRLKLDLVEVNKIYATSLTNPENKKLWVHYTRYDNEEQYEKQLKKVS